MKFGKLLQKTTEDMGTEMESLFVRYKELKKHLKAMKQQPKPAQEDAEVPGAVPEPQQANDASGNQGAQEEGQLSAEETAFVNTLNEDLLRFNQFFIDREEDSVIKLQALSDRIMGAQSAQELQALKAELVDFHGEMVLLLHWSLLNYAAVVKILKKHDKRSGLLLRAPYLANVLQQPFYSTSVMSRLVKNAEEHINTLVIKQQNTTGTSPAEGDAAAGPDDSQPAQQAGAGDTPGVQQAAPDAAARQNSEAPAECEHCRWQQAGEGTAAGASSSGNGAAEAEEPLPVCTAVFARTRMALETWDTLSSNASTPSTVLPAGSSELVRQLRVRERWARIVGVPPAGQQEVQQGSQQGQAAAGSAVQSEGAAEGSVGNGGSCGQQTSPGRPGPRQGSAEVAR
eukprot:gene2343-2650_t